jgi:hypothetical protein
VKGRIWPAAVLGLLLAAACAGTPPTPTAPPVITASPLPALPAGAYDSTAFKPKVTVTLPAGWAIVGDDVNYFGLQPVTSEALGIHLFRSPRAASQDLQCPETAEPGVGLAAADLVEWIRVRPGLTAGDATAVTLGSFAGLQVDAAIRDGWTASCPFANGTPTVPLFVGATDGTFRWVMAGSERLRLIVLDVPGKGTIVVDIDAFDGSLMDGFLPVATPIVQSIKFGLP